MASWDVTPGLVKIYELVFKSHHSTTKVETKNHTETTISYYQTVRYPTPQYSRRRENLKTHIIITTHPQWLICVAIISKYAELLLYSIM